MVVPREGDNERLKRVARYLYEKVILITSNGYPVQEETNQIVLTTDADWATCEESRRSNSGGTVQLGNHLIAGVESGSTAHCSEFGRGRTVCWNAGDL